MTPTDHPFADRCGHVIRIVTHARVRAWGEQVDLSASVRSPLARWSEAGMDRGVKHD
jgi:hypothetical protein